MFLSEGKRQTLITACYCEHCYPGPHPDESVQGAACDSTESCWWDRNFCAQRLDLEGKHKELLCDSGKSRTLVKHKRLIFTEGAMTQSVLWVIYGVNAIVKYPGRFSRWLQTLLSHHLRVLSDSQVFASTCGAFCVARYTKANEWSICVHTVHLTVAVFEVTVWRHQWCLKARLPSKL